MIEKSLRNYLAVAVRVAAVLMGARSLWQETVKVGCLPVDGRNPAGAWMDGCASDQIGSYGLDVLWFDLDPRAVEGIERAKVLMFGDSRILTGMSDGIASAWFAARRIPMYLLAFGAGEQSGFTQQLIERLQPHPQMVVIDADPYFTGEESIPAQAITDDPAGEERTARATKAFLDDAPVYCRFIGALCGRTERGYRTYLDGTVVHQAQDRVWWNRNQAGRYPINQPGAQVTSHYGTYLANARKMVAALHINPQCVVFTILPNSEMDDTLAKYLAQNLGARVVAPRVEGLDTIDHYHMTPESSQIWTKAFFARAQPIVQECVGDAVARSDNAGGPVAQIR
jgi:hypothetical protein